ncbi:hypothetical protein [Sphingomonas crocodyli]|uniref:Uncharacterized protein n=1 Tax=Sphingomonas crocodyli TaxID=1979270 RepID=A0A437M9L3_9SPHN|nr:hypothetical protein [Sphingomonas crocodyli]RVT94306.1 hypothetical protein EOD43_10795 [Sphingomonas crocodyli]
MAKRMRSIMAALLLATAATGAQAACPDAVPTGFKCRGNDNLIHEASGTVFPKKLAGFTRFYEQPFDLVGHDVTIAYGRDLNGTPIVARVALIHIEAMTPKEHYLGMKSLIGQYFGALKFSDLKPAGEGPFDPPGMKAGSGYQGRFTAVADGQPYELSLSTVSFGYWSARLTAAYPSEGAAATRAQILELARKLEVTGPAKPKK